MLGNTCIGLLGTYSFEYNLLLSMASGLNYYFLFFCDKQESSSSVTQRWVRSRKCGCLVTWFCYQMIAKPGNKTATASLSDPYADHFDVMTWPCFLHCWPFVRGIHQWLVDSSYKEPTMQSRAGRFCCKVSSNSLVNKQSRCQSSETAKCSCDIIVMQRGIEKSGLHWCQ